MAKLQINHRFYKSAINHRDTNYKTTRLQDYKTTRLQDYKTTNYKTTRLQDSPGPNSRRNIRRRCTPDVGSSTMQCKYITTCILP